ncbi:hypothetical protein FOZ62_025566 [Perkinsus olseni]|uniref:Uncharacterized protein n=1 Tax=Perkinsus olseni TaxID=32597 RepID=A0A7J6QXR8_PEROL|nr:hypothetical protein FOZ62_025566 [Perkinsus olseni]
MVAALPVEVIYGGFLSLSLLFACLMRRMPGRSERQAFGCVLGIITLAFLVHNITLFIFLITSMVVLAILPKDWIAVGLLVYSFAFLFPAREWRKSMRCSDHRRFHRRSVSLRLHPSSLIRFKVVEGFHEIPEGPP